MYTIATFHNHSSVVHGASLAPIGIAVQGNMSTPQSFRCPKNGCGRPSSSPRNLLAHFRDASRGHAYTGKQSQVPKILIELYRNARFSDAPLASGSKGKDQQYDTLFHGTDQGQAGLLGQQSPELRAANIESIELNSDLCDEGEDKFVGDGGTEGGVMLEHAHYLPHQRLHNERAADRGGDQVNGSD